MSERTGLTTPLREREFRLLFSGQVVSNLGDWLDFLALMVLVAYVWKMGAPALAALAVVVAVPWIVVAPFAGVYADRWPKRTVMVGCDLFRAVIVCGLIFAPNLGVLLVLVFLKNSASTLFTPAEEATIRTVVAEDLLHAANALSHFVTQATKVIGPALGGILVSVMSPRAAFGVDAATFAVSAVILSRLRPVEAEMAERVAAERAMVEGEVVAFDAAGTVVADAEDAEDAEADEADEGVWAELVAGLRYIVTRRTLLIAIGSLAAAMFMLLAFDTLSPLAFEQLGASRSEFGLAIAGVGFGGAVGAVAVGRYAGGLNEFVLMGAATVVIGGLVGFIGFMLIGSRQPPALLWAPVLFVVGLGAAGVLIAAPTILQKETPPELMGRVSASAGAVPTVFQVLAPVVGAAVAKWQSVGFVFAASGIGLTLLGVVVVILRPAVGVGVLRPTEVEEGGLA